MTEQLLHRGPDAGDVWADDGVAFGHRRLAIVDLSEAGAQPMRSACGRFLLVFNGEIYNHMDLRRHLEAEAASVAWRGQSDTETLLAGIVHWGLDETLKRASGMFALALWDRRGRRLCLARDRMGEKPLYWGWAGSNLVFASELKALRQHPGFPKDVCRVALALYLQFAYVPAPRSIHPGLYKLEPGCVLELQGTPPPMAPAEPLRPGDAYGSISIRRYWSLNELIEAGHRTRFEDDDEAVDELERGLTAAVGRQMVADVPLGAFLSGGIDSSLIVALMQAQSGKAVRTFTVGFEDAAYNEAPYAAAVARHLGTQHTEILVTEREAMAVIPDLPRIYDEPFADSSQIPTHLISRAARAHVTVALSGDGGDELFGGYNRYVHGPRVWSYLSRVPRPLRKFAASAILSMPVGAWNLIGDWRVSRNSWFGGVRLGEKLHRVAHRANNVSSIDELHLDLVSIWGDRCKELLQDQGTEYKFDLLFDDPLPLNLKDDPAGRMMVHDMRTYLPDDILCKVDRAAMAVSLETRVPFLDPEVLRISTRLPVQMKIRGNQGKWPLRQILYRHVPRQLIERPKSGFSIPVGEWLRGPLRDWAAGLLSPNSLRQDGLIEPGPVEQAWTEHLSGQRDWSHRLWIILMFMAWRHAWR